MSNKMPPTRHALFTSLFPSEKSYRWKQIGTGLFEDGPARAEGFTSLSALPALLRTELSQKVDWMSLTEKIVLKSKDGETFKAALCLKDGLLIESVLMLNARDDYTICVSSQVGCAMNCAFCATGKMGLKRNLTEDEIVDQYRFWKYFVRAHKIDGRISNIVFMGMGEPMANYENVKAAITTLLAHTDVGPNHITVSSVGLIPALNSLLQDSSWPPVKIAISLHSAVQEIRKGIVPSTTENFIRDLKAWSISYLEKLGNRQHFLTFEYVMLSGINDSEASARALARLAADLGRIKINLIPYNFTGTQISSSPAPRLYAFKSLLEAAGVTVTIRRSMGEDIAAACGQLVNLA
ncbi:MAG: 23S rRNA (adenine(2503)-C(2))-methyltransferase RlmN [Candidatus Gracilibacteria bacterium]|jgi:23S rRNA (adenine2503-C2)-methyltransferase